MKMITKIGVGAIICGIVFSAVGVTVFALNYNKFNEKYLGEPVSYTKNFDEKISEIELDISFMNIDIKKGDELKITAESVPEKLLPDIDISDKKLKITDKDFKSRMKEKNFQLGNIADEFVGTFTVYIPDKTLDKADINSAFSSLEISGLKADKLDIECSFGEYILNDSNADKLDFVCSFGNVSISDTECAETDFTNSFGSFETSDLKIKKSGNMENSFGNMDINLSGNNYEFSIYTSMGGYSDFTCPSKDVKIKASNSFGDINFTN